MNDNELVEVEEGAFDELGSTLERIYLQNNRLPYFPSLPQPMEALTTVDLSNNLIKAVGFEGFDGVDQTVFNEL